MKKYYDKIFEMLKKNNIRRRRIMAIVLVLSLFTSSGVVWVLRDIGITMVNEAVCGIEEHSHSDSCFDENGTMVCKVPEHIHTVECFLTDKFPDLMLNNGVDLLADENYPSLTYFVVRCKSVALRFSQDISSTAWNTLQTPTPSVG